MNRCRMMDLTCNKNLKDHIHANLNRFAKRTKADGSLTSAAVAIAIVDVQHDPRLHEIEFTNSSKGQAAVILTRRAATLRNHAGQWALPGGRVDDGESPEETALRELDEEVGLRLEPDRIIGRLDDYGTRSGFLITPVVVWAGAGESLTPDTDEVASAHRIPLSELMRKDAPILGEIPESEHPVLFMPIGNSFIAAPTAAMIYQFREVALCGNDTRVDHFEQPHFAWR
jgi:8-oxo-dGTP pyrophosphatase MutT (NUDIX family)